MKKIVALLVLILSLYSFKNEDPLFGNFAYTTPNKDTLYLLEGDPISKVTYDLWKKDSTWKGNNPSIVFVDTLKMQQMKSRIRLVTANR